MKTQIDAIIPRDIFAEIGERRFVMYNIGWGGYQGLLRIIGDGLPRLTYVHGDVELMKPMLVHERCRSRLDRVISIATEQLDLPGISLGSTTFHRREMDCGLEPDESYYLANAGRIGRKNSIELGLDPPPDLAIDIEITRPELNRVDVYASLGFPELWRFDGAILEVLILDDHGHYHASESSLAFPMLPMKDVEHRIRDPDFGDDVRWSRSFRAWLRDVIPSSYESNV